MTSTSAHFHFHVEDENKLAAAYMPFIRNGGLFIHTGLALKMGQQVLLQLSLLDSQQQETIQATVIWISPARAQDASHQGVGLQFSAGDVRLRTRIEDLLAANTASTTESYTL